MTRLLLTGFEPFGGMPVNPSWEAVRPLDGEVWGEVVLRAVRLPVSYAKAPGALRDAIETFRPDAVVMFGLAQARNAVALERVARNRSEGTADNEGATASGAIEPGGPATRPSTLPLDRIHRALAEAGIPAGWSDDAGGYLCNRVFWEGCAVAGVPAGFVHLPPFEAIPEGRMREAVRIVADAVAFERVPVAALSLSPEPAAVGRNAAEIERLARGAAAAGVRLALFPELATTGLAIPSRAAARRLAEPSDGDTPRRLAALAAELGMAIGWGFVEIADDRLFNAALLVEPGGQRHLYRKRRLYGHDFDWASPGESPGAFQTALGRVAVVICHDVVYSDIAAESARVDLVLMPTNWIGETGPEDCLRAFRAPVLVADRQGTEDGIRFGDRSGLYLPDGRVLRGTPGVDWKRRVPGAGGRGR